MTYWCWQCMEETVVKPLSRCKGCLHREHKRVWAALRDDKPVMKRSWNEAKRIPLWAVETVRTGERRPYPRAE